MVIPTLFVCEIGNERGSLTRTTILPMLVTEVDENLIYELRNSSSTFGAPREAALVYVRFCHIVCVPL